ncbi:MAG: DegT/DnrJ/EryC1/StrS family aminotransferase [Pseudomonadota bacterium]|nr:DegT/DnrJ/EryC1/StrS family aminotransferase [Pseudomonadota bacterium]
MIPVNDLARLAAEFSGPLTERAAQVLGSGHYVLGPWVTRFEQAFAGYCGVDHCIGVANGTDALELALRALGVGPGSTVAVAANAAMYGTTAVLAVGAEPLFVDVDPVTGLMTAEGLQAADVDRDAPPVAVIVTHLYGRMAHMPALLAYARSRGIAVVEDCAQAHGATDAAGRKAGSYGDLATFSFYPTKNLGAIGDGGALTAGNTELATRVRQLRQYGWSSKYTNTLPGGRNSRLDELQAAFLCTLLPVLDARNARRRDIANRYSREIVHPAVQVPPAAGADYVAHLYVVQSPARAALSAHLRTCGIGSDIHYPTPDYRQPVHGGRFDAVSLPVTEALCEQVLTLPCFPEMHDAEVDQVIAACNGWSGQ